MELPALEGRKVIEVKPAGPHKGTAATRWLSPRRPDFILALDDDRTDEDTFAALPPTAYTVKVGRFGLPGPTEVRELLRQLL
jgi:trehalose 6-phosphate synthase/phosphatase